MLSKLSEIGFCDENASDNDENFDINVEINFGKNAHKISSSECNSSDSELKKNTPSKYSRGSHETQIYRINVLEKIQNKGENLQKNWEKNTK